MKAEKYGTPTEQRRFDAGWRKATDRKRCDTCARCKNEFVQTKTDRYSCVYFGFATQKSRVCDSWLDMIPMA